jgi:MFS family permease
LQAASSSSSSSSTEERVRLELPPSLRPVTLGVFAQMLGEGISLSSLPLYLTARHGAGPVTVGLAISCFSVCQMAFAPLLVGWSSRAVGGRSRTLRLCLGGAAASSLLIAASTSVHGVIAGRALAGVFAACVPVAQSAVTDVLQQVGDTTDEEETAELQQQQQQQQEQLLALGLSRVSAASQLGVVVGPLASAAFQHAFEKVGVPLGMCLPAVFVLNAVNALLVLGQMTVMDRRERKKNGTDDDSAATAADSDHTSEEKAATDEKGTVEARGRTSDDTFPLAQLMLRTITIIVGWTAILSNSIYGLFAPRAMGFQQAQLSATYSTAAILMVTMQILFVRLVAKIGEHRACSLGILAAGLGIGGQSLIRFQPLHSMLYFINRAGAAIADTSTAALVASSSTTREDRSRNLALLTSTRAAARIFSPLLSGKLFELSMHSSIAPGALPFVTAGCLCMAVAPFPSILKRAQRRMQKKEKLL